VRDPLGTLVHACQGRDVQHVLVDGRLVVEDGMPVHVDPQRVAAEAERAAQALWRRAGSLAVPDAKGG
jgi:5-methylthioadenosine/S-adenosylhomocysteine deaminase